MDVLPRLMGVHRGDALSTFWFKLLILMFLTVALLPLMAGAGDTVTRTATIFASESYLPPSWQDPISHSSGCGSSGYGDIYKCFIQPREPDNDNSYAYSPSTEIAIYLTGFVLPSDITPDADARIISLQGFIWLKSTDGNYLSDFSFLLVFSATTCPETQGTLTTSYVKRETALQSQSCSGGEWMASDFNLVRLWLITDTKLLEWHAAVTYMGIVLTYTVTESSHASLSPPSPICTYNRLTMAIDCRDGQDYGDMNVLSVDWQVNNGSVYSTAPNGRVSLPTDNLFKDGSSGYCVVKATANYLSGARVSRYVEVRMDDLPLNLLFVALIALLVVCVIHATRYRVRK